MAYNRDITTDDRVFYDTDQTISYTVYQGEPTAAQIAANTAVPQNVAGWSMAWVLRKAGSTVAAVIEKTTGGGGITITGTYNVDPTVNTQRVLVLIEDTDTYGPEEEPVQIVNPNSDYEYALKRTDDGSETILAYGTFALLRSAAWE
jgi:hypothetical protein